MKKCKHNVKIEKSHYFQYLFHIIFISFWHFGARDPGMGPKAAARGPGRAWPAAALGPGPGFRAPKCENNMKIIWKKCENNVISQFHIIFTFYSYYFHIFITFLASGPRSGPQKSYFCHIPGHIFFILFSYFCENLVFRPVHTDNLYKVWCMVFGQGTGTVSHTFILWRAHGGFFLTLRPAKLSLA